MRDLGLQALNGFYRNGLIKSIQRGSMTLVGTGSNTATINAVDPNNAILRHAGSSISSGGSGDGFSRVVLTNGTTVTANRGTTTGTLTVMFEVIEFYPGVIKSIQRGTITTAAVASNTATINKVDLLRAQVSHLGNSTSDNASGSSVNWLTRITLTDNVTLTVTCSSSNSGTQVTSYEVVEFY